MWTGLFSVSTDTYSGIDSRYVLVSRVENKRYSTQSTCAHMDSFLCVWTRSTWSRRPRGWQGVPFS